MSPWVVSAALILVLSGCAERYRDADAGRSAQEIEQFLIELGARTTSQSSTLQEALKIASDANTNIYFAESYAARAGEAPPMGPVQAVAPIIYPELGIELGLAEFESLRIFFFDQIGEDGRHNHGLIIDYIPLGGANDQKQSKVFAVVNTGTSDPESSVTEDGLFQVSFQFSGKTLILSSDDTDEGELRQVVQFQLSINDGQEEYSIGQISSMVGYLAN